MSNTLELLAPAKNLIQGKAAINHGADAVYIGAPLFGARVAAGNKLEDIETLSNYAHLFRSKVFATVNTLLFEEELEEARNLIWQLYNIGVDALIVQDMGLLELDLPPIELHASTQTHNIDPRRVKFLEQAGFKRIILARETSLEQMAQLRQQTTADLEAFIHGALCVCYSGQCYMSLWLNGRSGNRGACSQPCRSSYDLVNSEGKMLRRNEHLLSLRDFNASQHLESMVDAGITSFKIEGRLKDLSYVKNVTAFYRQLLDNMMEGKSGYCPSSSGKTRFFFTPDPERTFNRGFTDYFLSGRHKMASHATQKSLGKKIATAIICKGNTLTIKSKEPLTAGDGLCFFNSENQLEGFLVNHVNGDTIIANKQLKISSGTIIWRNNDFLFEKRLQGDTSERKIAVSMTLEDCPSGIRLSIVDEDHCQASASIVCEKTTANNPEKAKENIEKQLKKLGGTPFEATGVTIKFDNVPFVPSSNLNELRRKCVENLQEIRIASFRPADTMLVPNNLAYFKDTVDALANIVNNKAEAFYRRHQSTCINRGLDQLHKEHKDFKTQPTSLTTPLMTCKYCLRYELGQCLMHKNNKDIDHDWHGDLFLINNGNRFRLHFDCKQCEMQIYAVNPASK